MDGGKRSSVLAPQARVLISHVGRVMETNVGVGRDQDNDATSATLRLRVPRATMP